MAVIGSVLLGTSIILLQSPIFFELLRRILTRGFWAGASIALGGFLAYLAILSVVFFGTYKILLWDSVRMVLFLVGSIILMSIGIGALKMKESNQHV